MRIRLAVAAIPLAGSALFLAGCAEKPTAPPPATRPALLANLSTANASGYLQVTGGWLHTCAIRKDGSLACWGSNDSGQATPPVGANFAQISAGSVHTCAVRTDGSLACWGYNVDGRATPPAGTDFAQVGTSAGSIHTCAVRKDGSLACWGSNSYGESTPPAGTNFVQVTSGTWHSCALRTDGSLACWGDNYYGEGTPPAGNNFAQVSAGASHTCAVRTDGSLACWGYNSDGQATPPAETDFAQVSAGGDYACAIRKDGSLTCWGGNSFGQATPPAGSDYAQIGAGWVHACAVRTDGSLACWGDNSLGQATPPATPQDAIQVLMADVRSLVSERVLKPGQGDGLLAKLTAAIPSLGGGRTNAACNQLQAFVNQVSGLVGAKQLSAAAGQELIDAAEAIRSQIGCGSAVCPAPAQGNSVLVDASRDGDVWWYPQGGPFSPESYHQGQALAEYLRGKGYVVRELAQGITITDSLLLASKIVIRAGVFGSYTAAELQAYQHFLACPRTLLLLGDLVWDANQDQLAEMLGVKFTGLVYGYVTQFAAHPITSGVVPLFYNAGAVVEAGYPGTVHILGWLSTGEPVMGVVDHGAAKVFFIGDMNGIESVPQPLVDNLVNWGF